MKSLEDAERDATAFDDLLAANRTFAASYEFAGYDGVAKAGVAMVTCMDSRIAPLRMLGLSPGDAKILRNPGGRVTGDALLALVLGVNLLDVSRVLIVQHTQCSMARYTEHDLKQRLTTASGLDASYLRIEAISDQIAAVQQDLATVRADPLIPDSVAVAGFMYDVDTGLLNRVPELED